MQPKYYLIAVILITSLVSHNTSQANNTKITYIGIGAIYSSTKLPPDFGEQVFDNLTDTEAFNDDITLALYF